VGAPHSEELEHGDGPRMVAVENASRKARVAGRRAPDSSCGPVDTVVSLDGTIYGKPGDAGEARATLPRAFRSGPHVTSGV